MELLLWLWFFDNRFVFSLKIPTTFYQIIWLLSILINSFIVGAGIYLIVENNIDSTMRILLFCTMCLCALTLIFSIGFIIKISSENKKYFNSYSEAMKTIPELSLVIKSNDFWVRHNSLTSFWGIALFTCSIAVFIFDSCLLGYRNKWKVGDTANSTLLFEQNLLIYYSVYELALTLFIVLELFISTIIKVGAFVSVYFCPGLYSKCSKCLHRSKRNKKIDFSNIQPSKTIQNEKD